MVIGAKLSKYVESLEANQTLHRLMVGSLLYFIASRLDIKQAISLVERFQSTLKVRHVLVRRLFIYLKGVGCMLYYFHN